MRAILCVGLHNGRQVAALAPRLVQENGEVVVGAPLTGATMVPTLGQRVTFLASMIRSPGLYDCEVCVADGVIIPCSRPMTDDEVPGFAKAILTEREWIAPRSSRVVVEPVAARERR